MISLKNLLKLTEKNLCQRPMFDKVAALQPGNF